MSLSNYPPGSNTAAAPWNQECTDDALPVCPICDGEVEEDEAIALAWRGAQESAHERCAAKEGYCLNCQSWECTCEEIPVLDKKTIFVFGSNLAGKHYGGAAKYAHEKFGAEMGVGEGRTERSYALPTLDENFNQLPLGRIAQSVATLKAHAFVNPDESFYVTRVGCGIAGFKDEQIAPLFVGSPSNCTFDPQWSSYGLPAWKEVL